MGSTPLRSRHGKGSPCFHAYSRARVARQLRLPGDTLTTRLGLADAAWNPADPRNSIRGPVDALTYRLRPDGRVEFTVTRGQHRMQMGAAHQEGVSKEPLPPPTELARAQRWMRRVVVGLLLWLTLPAVAGFLIGYFIASDRSGSMGLVGLVAGVIVAYVLQLLVTVTLQATGWAPRRREHLRGHRQRQ